MPAWIEYDSTTGAIRSVSWSKPDGTAIEIAEDEALAFLSGRRSIVSYRVVTDADVPILEEIKNERPVQTFWKLESVDRIEDLDITIHKNHLIIKSTKPLSPPAILFATLPGDPTWLVSSWDLVSHPTDKNGCLRVKMKDAKNYGYYMSKAE